MKTKSIISFYNLKSASTESTLHIMRDKVEWRNKENQIHREDGPAVEWASGQKDWYIHNKRHREDGPAIEWADGTKSWHINGKHHRLDGPALEDNNGFKMWFVNNKLHRTDGPAIEYSDGTKEWHLNNKLVTEQDVMGKQESTMTVDQYGIKSWRNKEGKYHRTDGPAIEHSNGTKYWYLNGDLHRTDGPAIECADGYQLWCQNGKLHREDGPAFIIDGTKHWYLNDKRHREDGPSVEWADGSKSWHLNGEKLTEQEFLARTKKPESTMTVDEYGWKAWKNIVGQLHRTDGPAVEWSDGSKQWYRNNKLHREDGPACECPDGAKEWWINGQRHREDGPAIERINGSKSWHLNGEKLTEQEFLARTKKPESTMTVDEYGNKFWLNQEGKLHRIDGPAIEMASGYKVWLMNGKKLTEQEFKIRTQQ